MKTKYKFGDKVKVLPSQEESTEYRNGVVDGIVGFVISDDGSDKFPVEVQFVGFSELFNYDELEFLGENIEMIKHLCKVTEASLGYQDRKILILNAFVSLEQGGCLNIFGNVLDSYDETRKRRVGSAYGCELIRQTLDFFGVSDLHEIKDYYCYVLSNKEYISSSSDVLGIEQLGCSDKKYNQKKLLKSDLEYLINEKS